MKKQTLDQDVQDALELLKRAGEGFTCPAHCGFTNDWKDHASDCEWLRVMTRLGLLEPPAPQYTPAPAPTLFYPKDFKDEEDE